MVCMDTCPSVPVSYVSIISIPCVSDTVGILVGQMGEGNEKKTNGSSGRWMEGTKENAEDVGRVEDGNEVEKDDGGKGGGVENKEREWECRCDQKGTV